MNLRRRAAAVATAVFAGALSAQDLTFGALPELPTARRGIFAGTHGEALIVAGGADLEGRLQAAMWVLDGDDWRFAGALPAARAWGASASSEHGVVMIGGRDARGPSRAATLWTFDATARRLQPTPLPSLPRPAERVAAAVIGAQLYVAATAEPALWSLRLTDGAAWVELPPWPGGARPGAALVAQSDGGANRHLYLLGGTGGVRTAAGFDPRSGRWYELADAPGPLTGAAAALDPAHVVVTGSAIDGGVADRCFALHTITRRWTEVGRPPVPLSDTVAVPWHNGIALLGAPQSIAATPPPRASTLVTTDFVVLVGYLAALIAIGAFFARRERSTADYFLAGRRIPWWAAGLSIYVTQLSAITFLSTPALGFATDWMVFPGMLMILLMAPIVARYFLPFYRRLDVTTAYEYLERRYHLTVRLFGSASFVIFQLGRMAIVVYLPALALATVTGLDVSVCILSMGVLATLYTVLGGMEAVIWTDVVQSVVLLGGLLAAVVVVIASEGLTPIIETALADDKLTLVRWDWSLTEMATTTLVLGTLLLQLGPYTTDQAVIQRYLTTRDERAAARGILLNGALAVPVGALFFALGTCLYVFYKHRPELLPLGMKNDEVLPLFVAQQLPAGLSGLVIAGIFAASMSSLDSSMHSIATAVTTDFYRRFSPAADDRRTLRVARTLTVLAGAAGTALALLLATFDIQSAFLFFQGLLGLLTSGLVALFLLGMFTERANASGAMIGALVGVVALFVVTRHTTLHFYLYPVVGIGTSVAVGYVASLLIGARPVALEGLTWRTLSLR